jgi:uncharacterized protein
MSHLDRTLEVGMNTNRKNKKHYLWLLLIPIIIIVLYFGIGGYIAFSATMIEPLSNCSSLNTPQTFGLAYSDVQFPARGDDLMIGGWYIPNQTAERAIILVHGRNSTKQTAVTCTFPELGVALNKSGFTILMIDTRGHGDSEGNRYSFGYYERRDVLDAVDFLLDKGFSPGKIGALGISNGSGAVIGAASEDEAIGALVLDSTIADMGEVITNMFVEETGLPVLFLQGADIMGRIFMGYRFLGVKPVEEVINVPPRPILMLHCTADEVVGFHQAELILEAVPEAKLIKFNNCNHAELYRDFPQEYFDQVMRFFMNNL